jgi:tol-pal system protein YbgF
MKPFRTGVVVFGVALSLAAPASAQNKREMQMMADIRMLQEQNQQLQVTLAQLGDALKALNGRLDDQANANRKAFADQNLKVDQFASDLRVVREGVSENNVRIGSLSQELEALRLSIPQYPAPAPPMPVDPTADPSATPPGTTGAPAPAPPPMPIGPGMSPQRLYDTAWADYTAGQWELCVSGFDTYLRTFPKSDLADEAQFHIGECNYAAGKHTEAVQAYNQVITNYPRGQAVADAYYKRGLALAALGQIDRARESFEQVMKIFPDSAAARLAKQNLDRLNRGKPQE